MSDFAYPEASFAISAMHVEQLFCVGLLCLAAGLVLGFIASKLKEKFDRDHKAH